MSGHRGASRGAGAIPTHLAALLADVTPAIAPTPQAVFTNTVESLLAAVAAGATWVETDLTRTRDGRIVLDHDTILPDGRVSALV